MGTLVTEMVAKRSGDAGTTLFGATRRAVLGLLLGRPDERFHLREIARLTGSGVGPVQREMAALTRAHLVRREQSGRQVYFQADKSSPVFAELGALIRKVSGAAEVLRDVLGPLQERIRVAVIFGSAASGTMRNESDVDLLVVSEELGFRDLAGAVRQASTRLGRDVNLNLYRPSEWAKRATENHPLVGSILRHPRLAVLGDPHELERLAEERVGEAPSA